MPCTFWMSRDCYEVYSYHLSDVEILYVCGQLLDLSDIKGIVLDSKLKVKRIWNLLLISVMVN